MEWAWGEGEVFSFFLSLGVVDVEGGCCYCSCLY